MPVFEMIPSSNLILMEFENNLNNRGINHHTFSNSSTNPVTFTTGQKFQSYCAKFNYNSVTNSGSSFVTTEPAILVEADFQKRFTVDFWLKFDAAKYGNFLLRLDEAILDIVIDNQPEASPTPNGRFAVTAFIDGVFYSVSNNYALIDDDWHHYAVVRDSNTQISTYMDGTVGTPLAIPDDYVFEYGHFDFMAAYALTSTPEKTYDLYLDELAIAPYAKWGANFTPPTMEYQH